MERTSSWLNEESTGNRYFERSSAGPRSRPSPRRYAHQKRPGRLLRVLLLERRIRRRYSIGKKSSCSSNFWNGGAAGKTCRNEPTPTPVLFAKAFDKTPSEALGFLVAHHRRLGPGASRPALVRLAAGKFKTVPSATLNCLVDLMKEARPETENQPPLAKSSHRVRCH